MKKILLTYLILSISILACSLPALVSSQTDINIEPTLETQAVLSTETPSPLPIPTETTLPSQTPTASQTPTITFTPTITETSTPSATPTFAFPSVTVNKQAHCRYGPNIAYLHAADLYAGDVGSVQGRFGLSKWLYIKFDKLK